MCLMRFESTTTQLLMKDLIKPFIVLTLILTTLHLDSFAQKKDRPEAVEVQKNSAFVELGGNSIGWSVNYSRILFQDNRAKFAFRAGVGNMFARNISVPLEVTLLYGNKHHFEVGPGYRWGTGFNYENSDNERTVAEKYHSFTLRAGYRLQQAVGASKVFASAGVVMNVTPGVSLLGEEGSRIVLPIPSASVGVSF